MMRIRMMTTAITTAITMLASVTLVSGSADAATIRSCSAGGFTGYLAWNSGGYSGFSYRINKGSKRGGNHANINMTNYHTNPIGTWLSPDSQVQDNTYHALIGAPRWNLHAGAAFIFDKSDDPDPRCTIRIDNWT
jgi:hypothetical protein